MGVFSPYQLKLTTDSRSFYLKKKIISFFFLFVFMGKSNFKCLPLLIKVKEMDMFGLLVTVK